MVENDYPTEESRFRELRSRLFNGLRDARTAHPSRILHLVEDSLSDLYRTRRELNRWSNVTPFDEDQYLITGFMEELSYLEKQFKGIRDHYIVDADAGSRHTDSIRHPDTQTTFDLE